MKFIHAGDIHLGNPFSGLDGQLPGMLKETVHKATITAFIKLIDAAISESVDFVLFPGDLYNAAENSAQIQSIVNQQFNRLLEAKIPVYLSFGNHDFEADRRQHLPWPVNVVVLPQQVVTQSLTIKSGKRVAITGFSYQTQQQATRIIDDFPQKNRQFDYQIGMYHGSVGTEGSSYAPFSVGDLLSKNYDYWALGHIHKRQTLNQRPFVGYSGNLQGLNLTETGPKGYYLVSDDTGRLVPTFVAVAPVVWHEVTFDHVADELDLIQRAKTLSDDEVGFWTIDISQTSDPEFISRITHGLTLEGLRANMASNVWIVRLNLIMDYQSAQINDVIDQQFWENSLTQLMSSFEVNDYLPNQVPFFVRDYFMTSAGKHLLRQRMTELISERRHLHED
ncbi:DNA repair exonuclease [Leuconostoc falkenbergense]|uniref:metallophosphoesterase family protein n=1 Tax=Leuconostoc falkenbergense TaxID=2766470 RepID=UPI0021A9EF89|nr:DNA repair exonuclease [Leuconostoc falkenbergense]MCT4411270.1 DNA repair exonuclease [Leuconostoc falkenbergense]